MMEGAPALGAGAGAPSAFSGSGQKGRTAPWNS